MKNLKMVLLLCVAMVISVLNASAVTYRNDSSDVIGIPLAGYTKYLNPGESITTDYYVDLIKPEYIGLTKVNDFTTTGVYYKFALVSNDVIATTGGVDVAVNLEANFATISLITGTIDIHTQSVSNTPPIFSGITSGYETIKLPLNGKFDTLVVRGSGGCTITQYKLEN